MDPNTQQTMQETIQAVLKNPNAPAPKSQMTKVVGAILGIIILLAVGGGSYYLGAKNSGNRSSVTNPARNNSPVQKSLYPSTSAAKLPTATPTPDPTAHWQIYTNAKYAYSVKYPTGLTSQEVNTYYHYVEFMSAAGALPSFLVSVIPDTFVVKDVAAYNYMSSDWIANIPNIAIGQSKTMDEAATFTRLKDMTIAGQDAVVIKVVATGYKQLRVYVKKNGYIYMLSNYYQSDDELANFTLFSSSFKFTQ